MTDEAVETEQFTQFQGGTVVNRLHIGQGPLGLQMALSAMSVMYDVKYVQHVTNYATRFLVFENKLHRPIESFRLLNLEMLDIVVSL